MPVFVQAFMLQLFAVQVPVGLAVHVHLERTQQTPAPVALLGGRVATFLEDFAAADADSEMGSDLGLDLGVEQVSSRGASDPATLAEYCAGPSEPSLSEGTRVKADWNDYGTMYPGKISDENSDGTVDIKYDDGFTEKNVDKEDLKIRQNQGKGKGASLVMTNAKGKPRNDPACKLQEFLKTLQDQLKDLNAMISKWLGAQRAKIASEDAPPPPPVTAPPSPKVDGPTAPPTTDQSGKLEKLKKEVSDLDAYIKELEAEEEKNDKALAEKQNANSAPAAAPAIKTVDDLIAEYEAKVAERQATVQQLLKRIKEQKEELAKKGKGQLTLKDIDEALKKLEQNVEEGKKKRDEIKKSGELDPELRSVIDGIIASLSKTRSKVNNLLSLEAKAEAEAAQEEREAKEAADAARKKAREEGKDEAEAAAEAEKSARKRAKERSRKANLKTMEAAHEVEKDLKDAEKGATKLDTGLHPHGERWWRYRYEHSYIEAVLMIFISFLMFFWSEFWRKAKHSFQLLAVAPGEKPMSHIEELQEETHGAIYACWLHFLADQMLVCIFVFLTLWLIAKTQLVSLFPLVIQPSEAMHVPHGPHAVQEYRTLALDICTIFFFAIVFYFGLMFSVAHQINCLTTKMETLEEASSRNASPRGHQLTRHSTRTWDQKLAHSAMGSVVATQETYEHIVSNFATVMNKHAVYTTDENLKELSRLVSDDFTNFPLATYLKLNVRVVGVELFTFSWAMWLPVIALFMCLMLLHRYAHMGYVRIMGVAGVVVLLMIISMAYFTKGIVNKCAEQSDKDCESVASKTIHEKVSTEEVALGFLQFALFFLCYGVARMICQPWMWELHFWAVFTLTIVAIVSAAIFVLLVAPGIPSFICAMSLPPYVDPYNMEVMRHIAVGLQEPRSRARSDV